MTLSSNHLNYRKSLVDQRKKIQNYNKKMKILMFNDK